MCNALSTTKSISRDDRTASTMQFLQTQAEFQAAKTSLGLSSEQIADITDNQETHKLELIKNLLGPTALDNHCDT